jgi:hypothetical protein
MKFPYTPRYTASALAATLVLLITASPVSAQLTPRLEAVAANQEYRNLELELALFKFEGDKKYGRKTAGVKPILKRSSRDADASATESLPSGELVVVCVLASQTGTLTLWSQMDDQQPVKIYPNKFTAAVQGAGRIDADEEVCVGHTKEFRLRVAGKEGQIDKVYAHWAPQASGQLDDGDFPAIGRSTRVPKSAATYASTTLQFRVGR